MAVRTDTDHVIEAPIGPTQIGNLLPADRRWHIGKTKRQLSVTLDDDGVATVTTVLGQSRTVTPYDYRITPPDDASTEELATRHTSRRGTDRSAARHRR